MKLPLKLSLFARVIYLPTGRSQSQCNETEALLNISFSIDEAELTSLGLRYPGLQVWQQGIVRGDASVPFTDKWGRDLLDEDFHMCLPREGACAQVAIFDIPPDGYVISWDGFPVVDGGTSITHRGSGGPNITAIEVGDCVPLCDDATETLFDYQYHDPYGGTPRFRVEHATGGSVELECDDNKHKCTDTPHNYWFNLFKARQCLKKDRCHRLVLGKGQRFGTDPEHQTTFSLRWGGDLIRESNSWLFESIKFGEGCDLDCTEEESLVEFYMYRGASWTCGREMPDWEKDIPRLRLEYQHPNFDWDLVMHSEGGQSEHAISNGVVPSCDRELFHESWCVPKGSCVSFHMSSANQTAEKPVYTLSMDGEFYRVNEWRLDNTTSFGKSYFNGMEQKVLMGDCKVVDACDSTSEVLFGLEVQNPDRYWDEYNGKFQSIIPSHEYVWVLFEPNKTLTDHDLKGWVSSSHFGRFDSDPGTKFHTLLCVPDYDCELEFGMSNWSSTLFQYKLERNGVELNNVVRESNLDKIMFGEDCDEDGGNEDGGNNDPSNEDGGNDDTSNKDGGNNDKGPSSGGSPSKICVSIVALALASIVTLSV